MTSTIKIPRKCISRSGLILHEDHESKSSKVIAISENITTIGIDLLLKYAKGSLVKNIPSKNVTDLIEKIKERKSDLVYSYSTSEAKYFYLQIIHDGCIEFGWYNKGYVSCVLEPLYTFKSTVIENRFLNLNYIHENGGDCVYWDVTSELNAKIKKGIIVQYD